MATSTAAFITSLATSLTVAGVIRKYTNPPGSLATADLPASFPKGFRRRQKPMTFQTHGGFPVLELDYFIACEPVGQSTQTANYTLIQTMADALDAALVAALPLAIGRGPVTWEISGGNQIVTVGGVDYWAVMATITGNG